MSSSPVNLPMILLSEFANVDVAFKSVVSARDASKARAFAYLLLSNLGACRLSLVCRELASSSIETLSAFALLDAGRGSAESTMSQHVVSSLMRRHRAVGSSGTLSAFALLDAGRGSAEPTICAHVVSSLIRQHRAAGASSASRPTRARLCDALSAVFLVLMSLPVSRRLVADMMKIVPLAALMFELEGERHRADFLKSAIMDFFRQIHERISTTQASSASPSFSSTFSPSSYDEHIHLSFLATRRLAALNKEAGIGMRGRFNDDDDGDMG